MAQPQDLDDLFAQFQKSRDGELLGQVFEQTAPALLRHALSLVRNGRDAEDLVQGVFMAVLTGMHGYDAQRSCMPYLYGVLRYRAKALSRRRNTPTMSEFDIAAVSSTTDVVEAGEFAAHVQSAIASLESSSREVVDLYLNSHLRPREIAQSLGRSSGTVRVQLHRGLAKLRLLLPAGVVVVLLDSMPACASAQIAVGQEALGQTGLGLAGLGQAGLGQAGPAQTAVDLTIPRWPRSHLVTVTIGSLLLLCLGMLFLPLVERADVLDATSTASGITGSVVHFAQPKQVAYRSDPERHLANVAPQATSAISTLEIELRWAEVGDPVTNVGATLQPVGRDPLFYSYRTCSDATGALRFDNLAPGSYVLQLDRGLRKAIRVAAGRNDLGIELADDQRLRGRVVDARGQPLAAAAIWVADRPGHVWSGQIVGHTADDGTFELRGVRPMMLVTALVDGFASPPLQAIGGADGQSDGQNDGQNDGQYLELRVTTPEATLAGTVLGAHGKPVCDAFVLVGSHPRSEQFVRGAQARLDATRIVRTDAQGTFYVDALTPGELTAVVRHEHHQSIAIPVQVAQGSTQQIAVQLSVGRVVRGVVRDAHGNSVVDAFVHARGEHRLAWAAVRADDLGAFVLEGLPCSAVGLSVTADGFEHEQVIVPAGVASVDLTLRDVPIVRGRLLEISADARWQVCLDRSDRRSRDGPPPQFDVAADGSFGGPVVGGFDAQLAFVSNAEQAIWLAAECRTNHEGTVELSVPPTFDQRGTIDVPLGTVNLADRKHIRLLAVRDKWTYTLEVRHLDHSMRVASIVPGTYDLFVDSTNSSFPSVALGRCEVYANRITRTETLHGECGTLEYSFRRRGEPPRQLSAWVEGPDGMVTQLRGFEGRQALRPGAYRLSCVGAECVPIHGQPFVVEADQVTVQPIDLRQGRRCELRWQATSSHPLLCRITDGADSVVIKFDRLPDAGGRVSLGTVLAAGTYVLHADSAAGKTRAQFQVLMRPGELVLPLYPVAVE